MKTLTMEERSQTLGEEIANSVSHGVGLVGALVATPILIVMAVRHGGAAGVVGASIFGASILLLYFISTLYHALARNRAKKVFQVLDHSAIFLLIAGTYTPFTLGVLRGPWGWTLFGVIWGLALVGVVLKAFGPMRYPRFSTFLYLLMGWLAVIAIQQLWLLIPGWGLFWLVAGGLFYTLGVVFYSLDNRVKYCHFIWHLFVLGGTTCHCIAVGGYA